MNGPVSQSLREKGLQYRVIYGVEWNRLIQLASTLEKDSTLACALWKEDIRECRLLALLLQPADEFLEDMAEIWIEDMHYPEEAQYAVLALFCRLPYAKRAMFQWIARQETMYQLCGYLLAARLFMNESDNLVDDLSASELLDQASSVLDTPHQALRSAVMNALNKYALLGEIETLRVERLLKPYQP